LAPEIDILQGSLDLLVLKRLSHGPMHGWGIAQDIQQVSRDVFHVGQGSLYPALYRLESQRLIDSDWGITDNNRRAKFYRLTAAGHRALSEKVHSWRRIVSAVELILAEP
jgi:PadR family transcriptional regulator PadR